jgi:cytochrome bd-type quinol oxidase subunit 2
MRDAAVLIPEDWLNGTAHATEAHQMVHIDWFAALLGISGLMVMALHGALWVAQANDGKYKTRAQDLATRLYWPVCVLVLATGTVVLGGQPHLAESFTSSPELWVFPMIGAAGLLGMHFCLAARWNPGSFLCSAVFIGGLLCSAVFAGWHSSGARHDRISSNVNVQEDSGSGRSAIGARADANDSV